MIPVVMAEKPVDFEKRVKEPGDKFLDKCPQPSRSEWENHSYWRRVLLDMRRAYGEICAYSACWIPQDVNAHSVDHYLSKDAHPRNAYVWSNFRYCNKLMNTRKGTHADVLDPFVIGQDWFVLDFPSLLVRPNPAMPVIIQEQVQATINRLDLNDEETCLARRNSYVECYCRGEVTFAYVVREAPFVAREIARQGYVQTLPQIMDYP